MQYRTFKPELFEDLIDQIWIMEHSGAPLHLISPPSPYSSISFSTGTSYYRGHQKINTPQVERGSLKPISYTHLHKNRIIGIRLLPYGLYAFLPSANRPSSNQYTTLFPLIGELAYNTDNELQNAVSDTEILTILYGFLSKLFNRKNYNKLNLVKEGYAYFKNNHEYNTINEFRKNNSLNYTTINRHFTDIIGIAPKKFERLIRFRKALCHLTNSRFSLTNIGHEAGYFDQSHFIREFELFMNCNPKSYSTMINSKSKCDNKIQYNFSIL